MIKISKKSALFLGLVFSLCFGASSLYESYKRLDAPYLTVIGGVNMSDGLGRQSAEMIEAMKDSMEVGFIPTYIDSLRDLPGSMDLLLKQQPRRLGTVIFCQEPIEGSFKKIRSPTRSDQIRIAYSMFESTRIPPDWVKRLNTYFDLVAVPDRFLIEVYQNSGVKIPIFELPLGRNLNALLDSPLKTAKNAPFVFGSFGAGIGRKNHIGLIRAFAKAFENRSDVCLALHCRTCDPKLRKQIQEEIGKVKGPIIRFTEGSLDQLSYLNFLRSVDCYVNPSKGEGFSIQPREAMALGIPTIVTDNTAQHTICQSGLVRAVPSFIEEPAIYEWRANASFGSFFLCTEGDLAEALLDIERNYERYLSQGSIARIWASQYHYEQVKPYYLNLLKPKKILLGSENKVTSEFFMTSSRKLYRKYQRLCQSVER